MNKLGLHITNLMLTIRDTEEKPFVRELALEELKKLNDDVSRFIFEWIDEIEELSKWPIETKNNNQMEVINEENNQMNQMEMLWMIYIPN